MSVSSTDDNVHQLFAPHRETIRAHLERLFRRPRADFPGSLCEVAWSDIDGAITSGQLFPLTPEGLDAATECACKWNLLERNLYVGVNPRSPGTAPFGRTSAKDVEVSYFHFVDGDTPVAAERLRRAPLPYTYAVTTGRIPTRRPHAYWELDEPVKNLLAWSRQQKALAEYFGGDNVSNADRVMRLAGTVSYPPQRKQARGYVIEMVTLRLVYDEGERDPVSSRTLYHSYPWVSDRFDAQTGEVFETPDSRAGNSHVGDRAENSHAGEEFRGEPLLKSGTTPADYVNSIKAGKNLHNNSRDLIAHLVETGHSDWLIREALENLLKPVSDGGTLGRIDQFIKTARQKWGTPDPQETVAAEPRNYPLEWYIDIQPSLSADDFVEGLLCSAGMSVIYGESNTGKTFFMTDLAFHIAAGRRWRNAEIEQGGVIYVALEGGFGIRNRIAAIRKHYGLEESIPFGLLACALNLLDAKADTEPLIELIKQAAEEISMPVKLIVIDTLARAMNGGNENAPEDMGSLVRSCDRIRSETGAHVAFIHHSGKDLARGARGHSSLRAATDTEIEITHDEGAPYNVAKVTKQRELEIQGEFAFTLEQVSLGLNRRGKEVRSCIVIDADAPAKTQSHKKMSDVEYGFMREIRELFSRENMTELAQPEAGMPVMRVVKRDTLRIWLIQRGKLDVTGDREKERNALPNAERQRLHRVLNSLVDKGFLGMNQTYAWLLA